MKNKEIRKLPDIIIMSADNTSEQDEYLLKSLTTAYFKFLSKTKFPSKKRFLLKFKNLSLPDAFVFEVEILFSIFNERVGMYINRGKFIKNFVFENDQLHFVISGINNDSLKFENYFIEKNIVNSQVFPCRFHPDFPYNQKKFFISNADGCKEIMQRNFFLDAGFNWEKIKCSECKKSLYYF